jgi:hypothetical protein
MPTRVLYIDGIEEGAGTSLDLIDRSMSESKNYLIKTPAFSTATLWTQRESIAQEFSGEKPARVWNVTVSFVLGYGLQRSCKRPDATNGFALSSTISPILLL